MATKTCLGFLGMGAGGLAPIRFQGAGGLAPIRFQEAGGLAPIRFQEAGGLAPIRFDCNMIEALSHAVATFARTWFTVADSGFTDIADQLKEEIVLSIRRLAPGGYCWLATKLELYPTTKLEPYPTQRRVSWSNPVPNVFCHQDDSRIAQRTRILQLPKRYNSPPHFISPPRSPRLRVKLDSWGDFSRGAAEHAEENSDKAGAMSQSSRHRSACSN